MFGGGERVGDKGRCSYTAEVIWKGVLQGRIHRGEAVFGEMGGG